MLALVKTWIDGKFSASLTNYVVVSDDAWGFEDMDGETYTDLTIDVPLGSTPITSIRRILVTKLLVIVLMTTLTGR